MNIIKNNKANVIRGVVIAAAVTLIVVGLLNGGFKDTFNKAIHICYECIGIG
jgi:hypothetical protein